MASLRVTQVDRELLTTVVKFANLARIKTTTQVESMFIGLSGVGPRFGVLPRGKQKAYQRDQERLREWLIAIAAGQGAKVADDVSAQLGTVHMRQVFDPRRGELVIVRAIQGVEAVLAYGAALLLDRTTGLTKRLGRCGKPGCGRFRIDFRPGSGRRWRHCNEEHRRAADAAGKAAYMRRWRKRS